MKIVTKNYSLTNGKRSYLVYLTDQNNNSLECYDVKGEEEKLMKENELSEKYKISDDNMVYVSLEEFKSQEDPTDSPLILVFYLDKSTFGERELIKSYGENVKRYLDEKGDNVRLFFMPTEVEERIVCINPTYIEDKKEFEKLDNLVHQLEGQFQLGIDSKVE
tara:strand:+ start:174 stop:662 length:489 start_codon:yes stop_codon:yes gene_type:complete